MPKLVHRGKLFLADAKLSFRVSMIVRVQPTPDGAMVVPPEAYLQCHCCKLIQDLKIVIS